MVEPITTLGLVIFSSLAGAAAGYAFGSSAEEERYRSLMLKFKNQASIIQAQEREIKSLIKKIDDIQKCRNIFQRFIWFVFQRDPILYKAFSDLERQLKEKDKSTNDQLAVWSQIATEFPAHPFVKGTQNV